MTTLNNQPEIQGDETVITDSLFIRFVVVVVINCIMMGIVTWITIIAPDISTWNWYIGQVMVTTALTNALYTVGVFNLGWFIYEKIITSIHWLHTHINIYQYCTNRQIQCVAYYIMTSIVIIFFPIKPIYQDIIFEAHDQYLTVQFARFDQFMVYMFLAILSVCFFVLMVAYRNNTVKHSYRAYSMPIVLCLLLGLLSPVHDYQAKIFEARAAWKAGNSDMIFVAGEQALSLAKTDEEKSTAYYWMGIACNMKGDTECAIDALKRSVELDPINPVAYGPLSAAFRQKREMDQAFYYANLCVEKNPSYPWCYVSLARAFTVIGYLKEADELLQKAHAMDPNVREITRNAEDIQELRIRYGDRVDPTIIEDV